VLYVGLFIYGLGALGAVLAPTLELVLFSRFIWGVGSAGPRVVAISMVRDTYSGDEMSKALSFIMAVFIMVPILAPSVGAGLIAIFPWQSAFGFGLVFAVVMAIWARVLPETLDPANRLPIDRRKIADAVGQVITNRHTLGYTMAMTMTFGVFTSYLASSERIFGEIYNRPGQFPLIFGGLSAVMGAAMLLNAKLIDWVGARKMTHVVLIAYMGCSLVFLATTAAAGGSPGFWTVVVGLGVVLSLHGLLIPNFNTIAMLPMGHIAGTASAVIGTVSLTGAALIGSVIDRQISSTVGPLVTSFAIFSGFAFLFVFWAERGKLFTETIATQPAPEPAAPGA
jgi:DHA1 family bicyclomycin/chloramphenicol resistance-like MFS transporter